MIELYQFDYSPYCLKVRAIMNRKDLDYEIVELIPMITQHKVRKVSGQSKVPVIVDGGTIVVDSTEIAHYLETMHPEPPLIPAEQPERRQALLWEDWSDEVLASVAGTAAYFSVTENPSLAAEPLPAYGNIALDLLLPQIAPTVARITLRKRGGREAGLDALKKARGHLAMLTEAVADDAYLVGGQLTLADIAVATASRSFDLVPELVGDVSYQPFFAWRDKTLAECWIN